MRIYTARYLLPVDGPPIEDAAVAIDRGRVACVGRREDLLRDLPSAAERRDLGDVAILPGLINAHTHVELSWLGQDPPPAGDFVRWIRGLLERRAAEDPRRARDAAAEALAYMASRGTVAIGDVSNDTWVVPLLAGSDLEGVAFHEIYGFRADQAETRIAEAVARLESIAADPQVAAAADRWRVVPTPHAPYTTSAPLLRALAGRALASDAPLSIHVAESRDETALLAGEPSGFAELLRAGNMWDDGWQAPRLSPLEYLHGLGVLSSRTLAVHCVQLTRADHTRLQSRGVTVITCPRSNATLDVGKSPVPELLREGIPVALGTDSLASAPDLDLFAEIVELRRQHPGLAPAAVLRMATHNGAVALGLDDRLGSIAPGKSDRLVVVPLRDPADDPLETLVSLPDMVHPLGQAPFEGVDT